MKSGIENPSKSEVIGCCGGDEKMNDHAEPTKVKRSKKKPSTILTLHMYLYFPHACMYNVYHINKT